jgi:dihydropteroate synthase
MKLNLGRSVLDLDQPLVMGVLNVTPDSFSDGGRFYDLERARRHAVAMIEDGAAIIDVGGESTRPGASSVSTQEEFDRVIPVIEAIRRDSDARISIDTSKPAVMQAAVEAGACLINDVYALRQEGAREMAAGLEVAVCLMHMQGEPRTMQEHPAYDDICGEVCEFLANAVAECEAAGISADRLLVDPGFGFGKTDAHNLELLANLRRITELELPMLVGLSRKRTLGIAAAVMAVERGANIVRTHDVAATVDAITVANAVMIAGRAK